jgi:hypothetical protein
MSLEGGEGCGHQIVLGEVSLIEVGDFGCGCGSEVGYLRFCVPHYVPRDSLPSAMAPS